LVPNCIKKLSVFLILVILLIGTIATVSCTNEAPTTITATTTTTATTTATATATTTATAPAVTVTVTPTPTATAPEGYPLEKPKVRFRVATTTSLYDTGLWYYLEPQFEAKENVALDIIYAGTGAALNQGRNGNVDAVAVHDPDQEKTFVDEGWGINGRAFAYNFFMIAGPADDPAGIKGMEPAEAFKKIAEAGAAGTANVKFASRGDNSGTHGAEKRLWAAAGYDYEKDIEPSTSWYVESGQGMGPTLVLADQLNAYVLCDGSTFLSYKGQLRLVSLVTSADEATLNIYDVYAINPEKVKTAKIDIANDFINWLISPDVQKLIGEYGVEEFGGSLFHPITDGGCTYGQCPNLVENQKPVP
jgi:tungstate transport system substrate-binding protein